MNNFTKTESLPKTGHVTEVCKEWLVREDGALAYKLQSQEINDFYKGNRFRNAVVREDFPTALNEQIKEKENAEKQSEMYRRRLMEQEEHDESVAMQIADKLERDLQEQKQRELQESEIMAQQMQEIYVNLPPAPPPGSRDKNRPPPRPAKASILHQNLNEPSRSNGRHHHPSHDNQQQEQLSHRQQHRNQPIQLQQEHFSNKDCYVGLSLSSNAADIPTTPQRKTLHQNARNSNHLLVSEEPSIAVQKPINQFVERSKFGRYPPATPNNNLTTSMSQQQLQHRHPHSSSAASSLSTTPTSSSACRRNVFESINLTQTPNLTQSPTQTLLHNVSSLPKQAMQSAVDELIEYSDVADSIRQYDISSFTVDTSDSQSSLHQHSASSHTNFNKSTSISNDNLLSTDHKFQKLSPEKYDQLVGNDGAMVAAAVAERHLQQHADDIELYVDPCDYGSLKEIGLPMEEIKEISKKLKQEQKDELLARQLQEMESTDGLSQEERDRLLAIEAQDKELAKMLQERERAKVKRSKEKARLRKNQQKDSYISSSTLCSTTNGLHCGPLLPLPQDCMSSLKNSSSTAANVKLHAQAAQEDHLDVEAYSNPIDVIQSQQRTQNGTLTNGSLTRDTKNVSKHVITHVKDDDIYTLPVDSCRSGQRPASLDICPENVRQHNSMTRSENYSLESHDSLNGQDVSPRMNFSHSGTFDQSSSPTPPYMPIQGTRRSNSSEDRKKKSKDKCTHQ